MEDFINLPPLINLFVNYLLSNNFCNAAICLLIDAIKATIDFKISALDTSPPPTLYEAVADVVVPPAILTTVLKVPAVVTCA